MTAGEQKKTYRHIRAISDKLGDMILTYGMIEIHSMYRLFTESFREKMTETEFYRFLYWHARFNSLLQTVYSPDGTCFAVMDGLDPARILTDMERYAGSLGYKTFPPGELQAAAGNTWDRFPELHMLYGCLHFSMGLPEQMTEEMLTDVCCAVKSGCTLPEVFGRMSALGLKERPLRTACQLWEILSGLVLTLPMPMLKGRSREEYGALKKVSPWSLGVTGEPGGGNGPDRPMYDFPAEIQERMSQAMCVSVPDMNRLASYRRKEHIRSEEFLYLLAQAYASACEFAKARKLADDLAKSSKRGRKAAEHLEEVISGGEMAMDDDVEMEDAFGWGGFWEEQAGAAKQQPYVRTQPKVGRNDPCPCGSGKKYKHCCGK